MTWGVLDVTGCVSHLSVILMCQFFMTPGLGGQTNIGCRWLGPHSMACRVTEKSIDLTRSLRGRVSADA